jgi:hypothetical protein
MYKRSGVGSAADTWCSARTFRWSQAFEDSARRVIIGTMILLVVVAVILVGLVIRLAVPAIRRRRFAAELRGDWWPRFEHEFRTYASGALRAARDAERHT